METYITHITLINDYLNQVLTAQERLDIEKKLDTDADFKALFDEHKILRQGMERVYLKNEITSIHNEYLRRLLLKKLGILFLAIAAIGCLFYGYQAWNTAKEVNESPKQTTGTRGILVPSEDTNTEIIKPAKDSIKLLLGTQKKDSTKTEQQSTISQPQKIAPTTVSFSSISDVVLERFQISTNRDTTLICNGGTRLYFPARAFKSGTRGTLINETIEIKVKEYHTLDDMLLGNLSTTSNGRLLETGGMLHVSAQKGEESLLLEKRMTVTFPSKKTKEDMQLFIGEEKEGIVNWELTKPTSNNSPVDPIKTEPIADVPFSVVDKAPVFEGCTGTEAEKKKCTQEAINRYVMQKFNINSCTTDIPTGNSALFARLKIKSDGSVEHLRNRNNSDCLQKEIKRVLESMPLFTPGTQRGFPVSVLYSLPIRVQWDNQLSIDFVEQDETAVQVFDTIYSYTRTDVELLKEVLHDTTIEVTNAMLETYHDFKKKKLIRDTKLKGTSYIMIRKPVFEMPDTYFKRLDTDSISRGGHVFRKPWGSEQIPDRKITRLVAQNSSVGNYVFNAMQLGWLNCDRFANGNGSRMKFKLKIKDADGANVKLVFKSLRSILNGNQQGNNTFDFGTITENVPVTLVAIQKGKEGYFMGMKDIRIEDMETLELDFKAYNEKELRDVLKKLAGKK